MYSLLRVILILLLSEKEYKNIYSLKNNSDSTDIESTTTSEGDIHVSEPEGKTRATIDEYPTLTEVLLPFLAY